MTPRLYDDPADHRLECLDAEGGECICDDLAWADAERAADDYWDDVDHEARRS